jgi:hypothetical protein
MPGVETYTVIIVFVMTFANSMVKATSLGASDRPPLMLERGLEMGKIMAPEMKETAA